MLEFAISIAVIVGFLALFEITAETAIVMIIYLQERVDELKEKRASAFNLQDLNAAIYEGAIHRVLQKLIIVFAILTGLAHTRCRK